MGKLAICTVGLVLILVQLCNTRPNSSREFDEDFDKNYHAHFIVDGSSVTIHATVKTPGWIGFGISPSGGMAGADIFMGGVKNGETYGDDYHGTGNQAPVKDSVQNWKVVNANEEGGQTEIEFTRQFNTGDKSEDVDIKDGEITVIWSYGSSDDTKVMHVNKGSKKVTIKAAEGLDIEGRDIKDSTALGGDKKTSHNSTNSKSSDMNMQDSGTIKHLIIPSFLLGITMLIQTIL